MTPNETQFSIYPGHVEYRSASGGGVTVIKVFTTGELRILAQVETFNPFREVTPRTITWTEFQQFMQDALSRQTNTHAFGLSTDTKEHQQ